MKYLQQNTRANRNTYNQKRINTATVRGRKKGNTMKKKVDEMMEHYKKNEKVKKKDKNNNQR